MKKRDKNRFRRWRKDAAQSWETWIDINDDGSVSLCPDQAGAIVIYNDGHWDWQYDSED